MTEKEAIELLNIHKSTLEKGGYIGGKDAVLEYDIAIKVFEEIRQYRAIGTVEECREARERQRSKDIIHNPDGGVDEDWLCPSCGKFFSPYSKHCQYCGQAAKVGDTP